MRRPLHPSCSAGDERRQVPARSSTSRRPRGKRPSTGMPDYSVTKAAVLSRLGSSPISTRARDPLQRAFRARSRPRPRRGSATEACRRPAGGVASCKTRLAKCSRPLGQDVRWSRLAEPGGDRRRRCISLLGARCPTSRAPPGAPTAEPSRSSSSLASECLNLRGDRSPMLSRRRCRRSEKNEVVVTAGRPLVRDTRTRSGPRTDCRRAHAVPARPRPDRPLEAVPPAEGQDAGLHRPGRRPLPHAHDAHARDDRRSRASSRGRCG